MKTHSHILENSSPMLAASVQVDVLDLRHFSAPALRPLLEQEAAKWQQRLRWDYSRSVELLLDFVNSRSLTGYVAVQQGRVVGYAFGVIEAAKAVMGDVYAFGECESDGNPVCELLLDHLLETLEAVPGVNRVESQLLLFSAGTLGNVFRTHGFRAYPRCFMFRPLSDPFADQPPPSSRWRVQRWQPEAYSAAAALIHSAYLGHTDSDINDQYRTVHGAQRFLHNIVHFPGCGIFDPVASLLLHDNQGGRLAAMILCSLVRDDVAHITQLCVRPDLRGRGLGRVLLQCCLAELRAKGLSGVSLTVTEGNQSALRLYESEGFHIDERFDAWVWERQTHRPW